MTTILQGTGEPLEIDPGGPINTIGERLNPSGRKKLSNSLIQGDWEYIKEEVLEQVKAGASVIDVNVGGKGIDEVAVLPDTVRIVAETTDIPLCIDTRNAAALKLALAVCPGRPLVNSISVEKKALNEILPVVAEHKVPVILLCMGQKGIPKSAKERLQYAQQGMNAAVKAGIKEEDVIIDPLVMTVGASDQAGQVVLETIKMLRKTYPNNNITGGASNISFGMPARPALNAHFLVAATAMGMNIPVTDPTNHTLRFAILSSNIFRGQDKGMREFMGYYRSTLVT